jgi:hypothetical protein
MLFSGSTLHVGWQLRHRRLEVREPPGVRTEPLEQVADDRRQEVHLVRVRAHHVVQILPDDPWTTLIDVQVGGVEMCHGRLRA